MGTNISGLVKPIKRELTIENLFNKRIAIDAFNVIYQFLTIIKGLDGKPLTNFRGDTTSHLSGMVYRNLMFLEKNIKPIYCFDGMNKTKKLRWKNKIIHPYIGINKKIIDSSKELLEYMGTPYIQGEAEGEAQACYLNKSDQCFAVASQDYDCLAFGGSKLIRYLAFSQKKKKGNTYVETAIEYINSRSFLDFYDITLSQIIDITILIGNDFFSGFKGYGEKNALKDIKTYKIIEDIKNFNPNRKDGYIYQKKIDLFCDINSIRKIFLNPLVNKNYKIIFNKPDYDKLKEFLYEKNNFSIVRVNNILSRLKKIYSSTKKQIDLSNFL